MSQTHEMFGKLAKLISEGFKTTHEMIQQLMMEELKPAFEAITAKMHELFNEMQKVHGQLKLLNMNTLREAIQQTIDDNNAAAEEHLKKNPVYG